MIAITATLQFGRQCGHTTILMMNAIPNAAPGRRDSRSQRSVKAQNSRTAVSSTVRANETYTYKMFRKHLKNAF